MKMILFKLIYLTLILPNEIQSSNVVSIILNKIRESYHDHLNQSELITRMHKKRIKRSQLNDILDISVDSLESMIRTKSNSYFIATLDKIIDNKNSSSSSFTSNSTFLNETAEFSVPPEYEYFVCDSESLSFMFSCNN